MTVELIDLANTPNPDPELLCLDLGCGNNKKTGFHGVDSLKFDAVDTVHDLRTAWPWADDSVDEVHMSHFLEHFGPQDRCFILNELWRVLKVGAKAMIICPNWSSCRAYGDPSHCWPPLGGFFFNYLDKVWRDSQAPHTDAANIPWGYNCHFEWTYGYNLHPSLMAYNEERRQREMTFNIETCPDIIATITKRPLPVK